MRGRQIWEDKVIVHDELPEKGSVKTLQGYTPAIALTLMQIGVSPTDTMVLKAIGILAREKRADGWPFGTTGPTSFPMAAHASKRGLYYVGSGEALTFTTALALWTIEVWHAKLLRARMKPFVDGEVSVLLLKAKSKPQGEVNVHRKQLIIILSLFAALFSCAYVSGLVALVTQFGAKLAPFIEIGVDNLWGVAISFLLLSSPPIIVALILKGFVKYGSLSWEMVIDWMRFIRRSS